MVDVVESVKAGGQIATPLRETDVFPPMVSQMITVGEETGGLDTMLNKVADFYEDEVAAAVKAMTSILEPIMIIFVGAIVGFVVIAMYMPMFKVYDPSSRASGSVAARERAATAQHHRRRPRCRTGGGGVKRLLGGRAEGRARLTLTPGEIVVEHGDCSAPLRFAPGIGRRRHDRPRARPTSARTPAAAASRSCTGSPPTASCRARRASRAGCGPTSRARRSPCSATRRPTSPSSSRRRSPPSASRACSRRACSPRSPSARRSASRRCSGCCCAPRTTTELERGFERYGFRTELTDREVPPTQRRHLPDDKPANPSARRRRARPREDLRSPPPGLG